METSRIPTTTPNDGDRAGLRPPEMLRSSEIREAFYVPNTPCRERPARKHPAFGHADLRTPSSEGFGIGAHTVSHKLLWGLTAEENGEL
jgi:hypothetical protein